MELFSEKVKQRAEEQMTWNRNNEGSNENENSAVKVVKLSNDDLLVIVNGKPTEDLENRPFNQCFTVNMVWKAFAEIDFVPPTCKILKNPKVRFELGEEDDHYQLKGLEHK